MAAVKDQQIPIEAREMNESNPATIVRGRKQWVFSLLIEPKVGNEACYGARCWAILYWHDRGHPTREPRAAAFRALCFARSATARGSQVLNEG